MIAYFVRRLKAADTEVNLMKLALNASNFFAAKLCFGSPVV